METFSLIILSVLIILASLWLTTKKKTALKSLPGPWGLPIVGYIPFITKNPHVKLTELSKVYGPVFSVRLGSRNIVVLCNFKVIKDAFLNDAFMGRPTDLPFNVTETTIKTGAFFDMPWKEQRRFSLIMLNDLGFGKTQMEDRIKEDVLELLDRMSEMKSATMSDLLGPSTSNNITSFLFGKRLKYDDPNLQKLDHTLNETGQLVLSLTWVMCFPWIGKLVRRFNIGNSAKLFKATQNVEAYCREELKEHESTLDPNHIRDYMDGYLLEIQKRSSYPNTSFQKDVLLDLSRAFLGAGSQTVRMTLDWMLLTAAAYPEVQDRIHKEIDDVLGSDRFPSWQDRFNMPFTEAAILEVMRWKTIVPLNMMRRTLKDTELNGYFIPKDTCVLAVLWSEDNNAELWGKDVHSYRPERFLSKDGTKVVKPDYFFPFSIGKRSCPGKSLAEIEIFLYVVAILQKFMLTMPPGKKADFNGELGTGYQPVRQEICLKLRK